MEEKKKLSYEELSKAASELHLQYQKLMSEYQKAVAALDDRAFNYTSFLLQMLFKVVEHPELYKKEFVDWSINNIESAICTFADSINESNAQRKGIAEEATVITKKATVKNAS